MKIYRYDVIAFLVAIGVMVGVSLIIPPHLGWIRGAVGFVIALIVFVGYLVIRKPDSLIELEELLKNTAKIAAEIAEIAGSTNSSRKITEIAQKIAHVATKCLTRDLVSIEIHVRRLARVAKDFRIVLDVFTGEIVLRGSVLAAELQEIESKKIPDTIQALDNLEAAIDEVEAKKYAAAESDLDTLTQLADLSKRSEETVAILKKIMQDNLH